jgi:prepilin-type N-terminal cleavage/methylation domain-containing protein
MQATLERLRARREERGDEGGFTLIELLIVIVILGILAAIVVFAVQNLTGSSAQSACKSDFKTVETGVEAYKAQMTNYPSGTGGPAPVTDSDATTVNAARAGGELFSGGNAAPNTMGASFANVGPWLKDVPANSGHYTISVTNDGLGTVQVLNAATPPAVLGTSAAACSSVS